MKESGMASESKSFSIEDYVRVDASYEEPTLQGQTGTVVALPDERLVDEYEIRLDGGLLRSVALDGKEIWIPASALERTPLLRPN